MDGHRRMHRHRLLGRHLDNGEGCMNFIIGKEYDIHDSNALPWYESRITYMGRNPYDQRHIFASPSGGTILVSDNSRILERIA